MSTTHSRRAEPCSNCGDTVLIAEMKPRAFAKWRAHAAGTVQGKTKYSLEHADPSPDGEMFDAVDEGCRRPRIG